MFTMRPFLSRPPVLIYKPSLAYSSSAFYLSKVLPELPKLRPHCSFKISNLRDESKSDKDILRFGPLMYDQPLHAVSHTQANWLRGLRKRVMHDYHCIDDERFHFYDFVANQIKKYSPLPMGLDEDELLNGWLANSNYNGKRQAQLRELNIEYRNRAVPLRAYKCKSFIKTEFYTEDKEARIINSRSDIFKALIGPWIHAAESHVYDHHFIKHLKPIEVADRMRQVVTGFPYIYETDYSSFEGSFTRELMSKCEFKLFQRLFCHYPRVVSMISLCYNRFNVVWNKRFGEARFPGSRMSGEMWTSLANGFTNLMIAKYMMSESRARGNVLVEGDDGLFACDKELDVDIARRLGFKLKFKETHYPDEASFCSLRLCDGKLVPDVLRTLMRYGATQERKYIQAWKGKSNRAKKHFRDFVYSKAMSLLAVSSGIPVLQSVAIQQMRESQGKLDMRYVDWWEKNFFDFKNLCPTEITDVMRNYVSKIFNISVRKQLILENCINHCRSLSYYMDI